MIRAVAILAAIAIACPAAAATVLLGNVAITYDETRWEISILTPASAPDLLPIDRKAWFHFICIAEQCRKRPFVSASAVPLVAGASCRFYGLLDAQRFPRPNATLASGPLQLTLTTTHSGCRAYTPAHRSACGTDLDFLYRFNTGAHFGCGGIEGVSEPMFRELLGGISLR